MQAVQLEEAVELGLGGPLEKILKRMLGSRGAPCIRLSEAWHEEWLRLEQKPSGHFRSPFLQPCCPKVMSNLQRSSICMSARQAKRKALTSTKTVPLLIASAGSAILRGLTTVLKNDKQGREIAGCGTVWLFS